MASAVLPGKHVSHHVFSSLSFRILFFCTRMICAIYCTYGRSHVFCPGGGSCSTRPLRACFAARGICVATSFASLLLHTSATATVASAIQLMTRGSSLGKNSYLILRLGFKQGVRSFFSDRFSVLDRSTTGRLRTPNGVGVQSAFGKVRWRAFRKADCLDLGTFSVGENTSGEKRSHLCLAKLKLSTASGFSNVSRGRRVLR